MYLSPFVGQHCIREVFLTKELANDCTYGGGGVCYSNILKLKSAFSTDHVLYVFSQYGKEIAVRILMSTSIKHLTGANKPLHMTEWLHTHTHTANVVQHSSWLIPLTAHLHKADAFRGS